MASGKAKYMGSVQNWNHKSKSKPFDFSPHLVQSLRQYCPHPDDADDFVNHVLSAARFAKTELQDSQASLTKQDIAAEHNDLEKSLELLYGKLRSISPELDMRFDDGADPLGCADALGQMLGYVKAAKPRVANLPNKQKIKQVQHDVMVEMAIRVLRTALPFGLEPTATVNSCKQTASPAVRILKQIGNSMGVVWALEAWGRVVRKVMDGELEREADCR